MSRSATSVGIFTFLALSMCSCGGSAGSLATINPPAAAGTATVYPAPAGEPLEPAFTISVQNQNSPVSSNGTIPAQLIGYGPQNTVSGVQFQNVVVGGSPLTASQVQQNSYVSGVTITP